MPHVLTPPATADGHTRGDLIAGKYRLEHMLGEGGMGTVWLARNTTLDVEVAIKLIQHEAAAPEAAERLFREARAAALLTHPGIVRVYDFGQTERGDPFIVMEALHGESLGSALEIRSRIPAAEAVRLLVPVAEALAFAHARGIVHRDLKPDNVMLVPIDEERTLPKIVDFGVAKLRADDVPRQLTVAGTLLGSPDYMSPEQARGREDVDERTDVWAFSVMLFETLTGKRPFGGANYNALLTSIIEDPAPSIADFAAGDAALATIVARGLEKRREDRWSSMREIVDALAGWAVANGITTDATGALLAFAEGRRSSGWIAMSPPADDEAANGPVTTPFAQESASIAPPIVTVPRPSRSSARTIAAVAAAAVFLGLAVAAGRPRVNDEPHAGVAASGVTALVAPAASVTSTASEPPPTDVASPSPSTERPHVAVVRDRKPRHVPQRPPHGREMPIPTDPNF